MLAKDITDGSQRAIAATRQNAYGELLLQGKVNGIKGLSTQNIRATDNNGGRFYGGRR